MDLSSGTDMTLLNLNAGAISTLLESIIYIGVRLAWSLTLKKPSCYLRSMTFKAPRSFELTIPSRLEEMQAVHELVGKAVKEYKLIEERAQWMELTIRESQINAI